MPINQIYAFYEKIIYHYLIIATCLVGEPGCCILYIFHNYTSPCIAFCVSSFLQLTGTQQYWLQHDILYEWTQEVRSSVTNRATRGERSPRRVWRANGGYKPWRFICDIERNTQAVFSLFMAVLLPTVSGRLERATDFIWHHWRCFMNQTRNIKRG